MQLDKLAKIMNPALDRRIEKDRPFLAGDWNHEEIKRSNLKRLDDHQKLWFDHNPNCPFPHKDG